MRRALFAPRSNTQNCRTPKSLLYLYNMVQKSGRLNKKEVGTTVPTSGGSHPRQNFPASSEPASSETAQQNPKKLRLDYRISPIWLIIWSVLMLINIIFGLLSPKHDILILFRVGSIALCLIYAIKTFPKDFLLILAMFATCISDIILAINNISPIGVAIFLATQIIHLTRLDGHHLKRPIVIFSCLSAILIIIDIIFKIVPLIFLVVALYVCVLAANILASYRWHQASPNNIRTTFAFAGFLLFACCDLCIGVSYLSLTEVLPAFLYIPANFFAWFFYYPSQVLLSNSGKLPSDSDN